MSTINDFYKKYTQTAPFQQDHHAPDGGWTVTESHRFGREKTALFPDPMEADEALFEVTGLLSVNPWMGIPSYIHGLYEVITRADRHGRRFLVKYEPEYDGPVLLCIEEVDDG